MFTSMLWRATKSHCCELFRGHNGPHRTVIELMRRYNRVRAFEMAGEVQGREVDREVAGLGKCNLGSGVCACRPLRHRAPHSDEGCVLVAGLSGSGTGTSLLMGRGYMQRMSNSRSSNPRHLCHSRAIHARISWLETLQLGIQLIKCVFCYLERDPSTAVAVFELIIDDGESLR